MKRTRDEPSHFRHPSSDYDNDDDDSASESGEFQPQQRKHFCVICTKQFSCGKAYGGHVRIHSSEYNNKGKAKKMKIKKRKIGLVKKEKEIDLIRADVERKIRCCLCGKEFQTMHSLFGHMRRHPDRSWKGIRPPPPEKLNLRFLDADDDNDDDGNVMSRSMVMSDVTEDVQEAACCLMMLSSKARMRNASLETSTSELRSSSCYNDDKGKRDSEMDEKGLIVDMKIKMENEVKVNNPQNEARKRSLGLDLNHPYHDQDHPYSYSN